jgi:deazaflavin-dependent oxidoreductase (nitroreductase family)
MPMPMWWAQINKRVFNPMTLRRGTSPVFVHVGRSSGRTYRTPLDAYPVDGGYLFILVYGSGCDWVRNAIASGTATLEVHGEVRELTSPRVITKDAAVPLLPSTAKPPPDFLRVDEYLRMDVVTG